MILQRDIVLLSFPFSDLKSSKVRPALVLSNNEYNRKFEDFIAVPLTTNLKSREHASGSVKLTAHELSNRSQLL